MNANEPIKALIGLGNPGKEYEHTYHNIGAWSLELLTYMAAETGVGDGVSFHQPKSFMNESGQEIQQWLKFHNLTPDQILIIHDDSDLPVGSYKLVKGGSSAGHNGVQNIIENLGTEDFWRLRIGIRDPNEPVRKKAMEFVLKRFPQDQEAVFESVLGKAWEQVKKLL